PGPGPRRGLDRHGRPTGGHIRKNVCGRRGGGGPGSSGGPPGGRRLRPGELRRHRATSPSMRLWAVLALLGMPLTAQSVQSRLEGRIPSDAVPVVDSLVQVALHEGLPSEPLVQKALEGGAKQVPSPRIVAAVQASLGQLRDAHELLVRAGDQPPIRAGEVTTVAWALRRKVPPSTVAHVVTELPHPPRAA